MAEDLEIKLRIRALIDGAAKIAGLSRELRGLGDEGQRSGKKLNTAFDAIGMRSFQQIERDIARARAGYQRLANSGRLSADQLRIAHRQMTQQVRTLRRELDGGGRGGWFGQMRAGIVSLQGAVAALGAGAALRGIVQITDAARAMEGQIRLVTESEEELRDVQAQLFQTAQRTRSAFEPTVQLYARIARNSHELGLNQQQLLAVTTATNHAIQIAGATSSEAAAGVIQFSQALASGELRGDEFRSVMENMPRLARALADGMGVTLGELRTLSMEGKLTAETVTRALLSQSEQLEREFAKMPRTVSQALIQLKNQVDWALKDASMQPLIDSIDDLRETVTDPAVQAGLISFATAIVTAFTVALQAIDKVVEGTQILAERIARSLHGPDTVVGQLTEKMEALRIEQGAILDELNRPRVLRINPFKSTEELRDRLAEVNAELLKLHRQRDWFQQLDAPAVEKPKPDLTLPEVKDPVDPKIEEKRLKAIQDIIDKLREQAATYGMTADQVAVYHLQQLNASEATIKEAAALGEAAAIRRQNDEAIAASTEAYAALTKEVEKNQQSDAELLKTLNEEIRLLGLSARERAIATAEARLSAVATNEQREAVARLAGQLHDLQLKTKESSEFMKQAARNIQSSFADFLFDPFDKGVKGMALGFANAIRRMVAEAMAAQALQAMFGAFTGGAGGSPFAAFVHHAGGMAGSGPTRNVSPALFINAPRYHRGGIAGLAPDEVPAILLRGERVLSRQEVAAGVGSNGGGELSVRIVNVVDPKLAADYLTSSEGERVVMNLIQRNAPQLKQVLS